MSIAPKGAAKDVCLSALIKQCVTTHRDELTYQNQNTFSELSSLWLTS